MKIIVLYLRKKYDITCLEDSYKCLTCEIVNQIGVPTGSQRLIYKGNTVQSGTLSGQGLTDKAKVMLIGSKSSQNMSDEVLAILDDVQLTMNDFEARLEQLREELGDFSQGLVPAKMRQSFTRAFTKRLTALRDQGERSRLRLLSLARASPMGGEQCLMMGATFDELLAGADCLLADFMACLEADETDDAEDGTYDPTLL